MNFSTNDIAYLVSIGFKKREDTNHYFIDSEDGRRTIIISYDDVYNLDYYDLVYDEDTGFYTDYSKEYSDTNQSLQDFLKNF